MLDSLGAMGWAGIGLLVVGLGVVALADPLVAGGLAIILLGLGLLVKRGIDLVFSMLGMA